MTVDLVPTWQVGDVDLTRYPFSVDRNDAVEIGEPAMVVESVESLLADGDVERVVRYGNRSYVLPIYIEGADLAELAESEALLRREIQRPGIEVAHNPGDDFSPTSVYEVRTAALAPSRSDVHESHLMRKFTLTLTCGPFARSADLVTVAALEVPGSETLATVDTCDSATGWSATINGAPAGVDPNWLGQAGKLFVYDLFTPGPQTMTLTRTGSFTVSATPYVRVDIHANEPEQTWADAVIDGASRRLTLLEHRKSPANSDEYRLTFAVPAGSTSVSSLTLSNYSLSDSSAFGVSHVARTDMPPTITPRQSSRIIETGGTERTPASIHVQSTTGVDGLGGLVMVHTSPEDGSGYSPPLRRWRTSASTGPETADANTLSGKWEDIAYVTGGFVAEVPTTALPEGGYVLMARLRSATADLNQATLFWSTSTIFPDTTTQQGFTNGNIKIALGATPTIFPVAALTLPSVRTKAGKVQIVLQVSNTTGPQVQLDDAWLFRADDDCALTIVNSYEDHLWLDSPDASSPVPRVWIGNGRDVQAHPGEALAAMGAHVLSPGGTAVFTAAMSDNPATDATFYRRWHSNAAE